MHDWIKSYPEKIVVVGVGVGWSMGHCQMNKTFAFVGCTPYAFLGYQPSAETVKVDIKAANFTTFRYGAL